MANKFDLLSSLADIPVPESDDDMKSPEKKKPKAEVEEKDE